MARRLASTGRIMNGSNRCVSAMMTADSVYRTWMGWLTRPVHSSSALSGPSRPNTMIQPKPRTTTLTNSGSTVTTVSVVARALPDTEMM